MSTCVQIESRLIEMQGLKAVFATQVHFHILVRPNLQSYLDYKTPDQSAAERRGPGTFAGQMATAVLRLLSCQRTPTSGSLEAQTYAIQHARSAVQLVTGKHPSGAKHGEATHILANLQHRVYLCVHCNKRREEEIYPYFLHIWHLRKRNTRLLSVRFINLLTPVTKKLCCLSEKWEIFEENIFFEFIYFTFLSPTQSRQFLSAS